MKIDDTNFWRNSFLSLLCYFSIFRIIFLILNFVYNDIPVHTYLLAFIHGLRFDITTIAFLTLPIWLLIVLISFPLFNGKLNKTFKLLFRGYYFILIPLVSIIYIIDIGFFWEYSTRINYLALEYLDHIDTIIGTILIQFPYNLLLFSIPFLIYLEIKILHKKLNNVPIPGFTRLYDWGGFILISIIILTISIRGGFQNKPLNWSHSNFSHFRLTNNIVLNPIWNLGYTIKSYLKEKGVDKFSNINITLDESIKILQKKSDINSIKLIDKQRPFLINHISSIPENNSNIIIILMESFAGQYIGSLGNNENITPEFDKLSREGILFTNMFSAGTRSNRGVSATLLSFPALPRYESIMEDGSVNQDFSSIATILQSRNYLSSFFYPGDVGYDNMGGFLKSQGFDNIYGQEIYDKNSFSTSWGVSDESLFNTSYEFILKQKEPFVTTILTTSNHIPYTYPSSVLKNKYNNNRLGAFAYSDMALGKFMQKMKSSPIYDRTIFVILGDHGFLSDEFDQNKSIELSSYHIPCLIIAPNLEPGINNRISGQIDIIPTILPLLGGEVVHHSWGKNLLTEPNESDYAVIIPSGINHKIGFIQSNTFLIYDFHAKSEYYTLNEFPKNINLEPIKEINLIHLNMEKTMLGFLKLASHTLNNYKCGINHN